MGAIAMLEEGQRLLDRDLEQRGDQDLDQPVKTNWGDTWPAWRIFTEMADHDALHTGAIGALRDLYYWTTRS